MCVLVWELSSIAFITSSWFASTETLSKPFFLPLICMTTTDCWFSAIISSSASGQGAEAISPPNWHACHKWCVMCGVIGFNTRNKIDRAYFRAAGWCLSCGILLIAWNICWILYYIFFFIEYLPYLSIYSFIIFSYDKLLIFWLILSMLLSFIVFSYLRCL